jgi:hypothetical protein
MISYLKEKLKKNVRRHWSVGEIPDPAGMRSENLMKLLGHPVRTGQAGPGFPAR